jgi:imidazolonepropionase-like amidohydrolase
MRRLLTSSIAIALAAVTVTAQRPVVAPQEPIALVNANVVDVRSGTIQRNTVVVLRGGRIDTVGAAAPPAGVRAIDLRGRYVVPGLIDAHVHIGSTAQMRAAIESGVTTVRSAGASHFVDVGLRELVRRGAIAGPDMIATGYHVRPGVAQEFFLDFPDHGDLMAGTAGADALRRMVRANLSRGVDWIKTNATERAGTPDTDPRRQIYSQEELRILVVEAGTKDIPVMAHAHGAEGADAAVRAGVRSIEHGTYLSGDTLQMMAKQGTYFDPTADIVNDLAEPGGDYDNAGLKRRGEMMQPILMAAIGRAHKHRARVSRDWHAGDGRPDATAGATSGNHHECGDVEARQTDWRDRERVRGRCPCGGRQSARQRAHPARSALCHQQRPHRPRPPDVRQMTLPRRPKLAKPEPDCDS